VKGWHALFRLAWRDVLRSRGRSALIMVMIALPVLGVTAAAVFASTQDVSSREGIDRRIGTADASLNLERGVGHVFQGADPEKGNSGSDSTRHALATPAQLTGILGDRAVLVPRREDYTNTVIDGRYRGIRTISADLGNEVFRGTYELVSGRLPERAGEVLVNAKLIDRGIDVGDDFRIVEGGKSLEVVGTAEDASYRGEMMTWAYPGTILPAGRQPDDYLVKVPGGVSWSEVRALNKLGVSVLSRKVIHDPPSQDEMVEEMGYDSQDHQMIVATGVLVATMALLEIVLLAGPAFAVGARRMQRNLAQVAATGGTPGQVRRAVLATAVVLGGVAAAIGLTMGVVLARIGVPIAQHYSSSVFGPFDVVWVQVLGIAALGWLSAVIAALVPAWIASRQDVVKVLAGRRGDRAPGRVSPLLGGVLFLAGLGVAVYGAGQSMWGEVWIAGSAVLVVLGAVLLLSPVVALVGRAATRAPLPLRYAVRDAARHRTRTVPAIGAVLATVAGVVALGIANASDREQDRVTYQPQAADGAGFVSFWPDGMPSEARADSWKKIVETTQEAFPAATVLQTFSIPEVAGGGMGRDVGLADEGDSGGLLSSYGGYYGSWLVADQRPNAELWLTAKAEAQVDRALGEGKVVLFTDPEAERNADLYGGDPIDLDRDSVTLQTVAYDDFGGQEVADAKVTAPAVVVHVAHGTTQGIVPTAVAARLGVPIAPVAVYVPGPVSKAQEKSLQGAFRAAGVPEADTYVERGWPGSRDTVILLWVLALVGGLLMLGGTLTATFLALSDAAPDLGTLSAVGAAPRERRLVAASYALVVGGIGAVLGAVVGLVPGIAATWPMTGQGYDPAMGGRSHYLDIPWLMVLGVVIGLPLFTALVVGLFARSRLPIVARID
jgi:putative ABC transport system permease protein